MKQEKKDYLLRHVKKAEGILSKLAYPNQKDKHFVDTSFIIWKTQTTHRYNGYCDIESNTIYLNENYFKVLNNKGYDESLISTIQHELIHWWIGHNFVTDKIKNFHLDTNPLFITVVKYFNYRGTNIKLANEEIDVIYEFYQDELKNSARLDEDLDCLYPTLVYYLLTLLKKIDMIKKEVRMHDKEIVRRDKTSVLVIKLCDFSFQYEDEESSICYVTYYEPIIEEDYYVEERNNIYLGLDFNVMSLCKLNDVDEDLRILTGISDEDLFEDDERRIYMTDLDLI